MKRTCYDQHIHLILVNILIYNPCLSSFVLFFPFSVWWVREGCSISSARGNMKVQCEIANGTNLELYNLMILEPCGRVLMAVGDRKLQNINVITCGKFLIIFKQKSSFVSAFSNALKFKV